MTADGKDQPLPVERLGVAGALYNGKNGYIISEVLQEAINFV